MRPVWHRDWAGFSGGWYPTETTWQLTILVIYGHGYFLDVMAPLIGDIRIGLHTRDGLEATRRYFRTTDGRFVLTRRPRPCRDVT